MRWLPAILLSLGAAAAPVAGYGESEQRQARLYCERFAQAAPARLSGAPGLRYLAHSAVVERPFGGRVTTFIGNLFQPPDSRFLGVWHCHFRLTSASATCSGEVTLPVAEHKDFADHTRWPNLMIVPDNRITAPDGAAAGYITPKYYRLDCPDGGGSR